jgi:hypothetical protein
VTCCARDFAWRHIEHLAQYRKLVPGVLESFRRIGLLEIDEQITDLAQCVHRGFAHAERDSLGGAEEVRQYRVGISSSVLDWSFEQ